MLEKSRSSFSIIVPVFNESNNKTILVALPVDVSKSISLLKQIPKNLDEMLPEFQITLIIRSHPQTDANLIKKNFDKKNYNNCIIGKKSTINYLRESDILISSMSSICMEALAKGKPCLVYDESVGVEYNPIPETINKNYWKLCKNGEQILNNLTYFFNFSKSDYITLEEESYKIRKNYFFESNIDNCKKFIN